MRRWHTSNAGETEALGTALGLELAPDGVLLLDGDLGAGKTVLARGVAAALGIDPRQVHSPTFVLIQEYEGAAGRLVHADLYRLESGQEAGIGLDELLAGPGVKVIEWADRLGPEALRGLGPVVRLELRRLDEEARDILERQGGADSLFTRGDDELQPAVVPSSKPSPNRGT